MDTITYLLGAGASANCLPIVSQMAKNIEESLKRLHSLNMSNLFRGKEMEEKFPSILSNLKSDLLWLKQNCQIHSSVDTFAKKLYLSGDQNNYRRLKNILSVYLTIEQKHNRPDLRYDNFWASMLNQRYKYPKNVRILSWNYDFQLELSYLNFANCSSLEESYELLGIGSYKTGQNDFPPPGEFSIFKINGSAKLYIDETRLEKYFGSNLLLENNSSFYNTLFKNIDFIQNHEKCQNSLTFSWEHDRASHLYQSVSENIKDTSILVVIGYSFPFFNRVVDRKFLKDSMPALRKVYFQAPDAENLRERFLAIRDDITPENLVLRKDKDQFVFPNEL